MNTYAIRPALISAFGVALALASGSALATTFRITDLGTLGGTFSQGVAINASGQVTGSSITASFESHAFLWDGTRMVDLGTLGGPSSQRVAINDSGQVTGTSDTGIDPLTPSCGTARGCRTSARWAARRGVPSMPRGRWRATPTAGASRLPVGRHDDAGHRHAGRRFSGLRHQRRRAGDGRCHHGRH